MQRSTCLSSSSRRCASDPRRCEQRLASSLMKSWPVIRHAATLIAPGAWAPEVEDPRTTRAAILMAPLMGGLIGVFTAAVMLVARRLYVGPTVYIGVVNVQFFEAPLLAAALAVVTVALINRGHQLAGLAGIADQLSRPGTSARAIADNDPPLGPIGATALACCLLLDTLALGSSVLAHHGTQSLLFAVVTGKLAMVWACTTASPVSVERDEEARAVRSIPPWIASAWTVLVCAGAAIYGRFDSDVGSPRGAVRAVVAVLVAITVSWLVRRRISQRLGRLSLASLGAVCEVATVVSLLITAAGRP
jgi:adenosylcobinamide-GDP ribazoletransferase